MLEEEVRGLEIPVDDALRVGAREGIACLDRPADDIRERLSTLAIELLGEVDALEMLHDDVRLTRIEAADVEDAADVLALDEGGGASLAEEALDRIRRCTPDEELDRDGLLELEMPRGNHDPHAALTEDPLDPVLLGHHLSGQDGAREHVQGNPRGKAAQVNDTSPTTIAAGVRIRSTSRSRIEPEREKGERRTASVGNKTVATSDSSTPAVVAISDPALSSFFWRARAPCGARLPEAALPRHAMVLETTQKLFHVGVELRGRHRSSR